MLGLEHTGIAIDSANFSMKLDEAVATGAGEAEALDDEDELLPPAEGAEATAEAAGDDGGGGRFPVADVVRQPFERTIWSCLGLS